MEYDYYEKTSKNTITQTPILSEIEGCSVTDITILNPDCAFFDDDNVICSGYNSAEEACYFDGIIHGYAGSTAQEYAEKYHYPFEALDTSEPPTDENQLILDETEIFLSLGEQY